MESLSKVIKETYHSNEFKLKKEYNEAIKDETFKQIITTLPLSEKELMKYTSKIEESAKEKKHCQKCPNILACRNEVKGYAYLPSVNDNILSFNYEPCSYQKKLEEETKYQKNIYTLDIPYEIKQASMKKIFIDDKSRVETIKWIKQYLDNYKLGKYQKGLYLTGNFGTGKTYLLAAMFNELAKKGAKVAIVYYPEFLRKLKSSFGEEDNYNNLFEYIKKTEILLIDDIGAEVTTPWARDEILGTILQYRMQERLSTFFTSNLNIGELESHLSLTTQNIDQVKARRIVERVKYLTEQIIMIGENKRK